MIDPLGFVVRVIGQVNGLRTRSYRAGNHGEKWMVDARPCRWELSHFDLKIAMMQSTSGNQ